MKGFIFLVLAMFALPIEAQAACASPSGTEGSLRYDSALKKLYFCNGTDWKEPGGTGTTTTTTTVIAAPGTTDSRMYGVPLIGADGTYTVTLCSGVIGSDCGGGIFAGDGNLVVSPAGCTGTAAAPSCASPTGAGTDPSMQWQSGGGNPNMGNIMRYGYPGTRSLANSNYPAHFYCKNLNYGGHTDWYLPTSYEMGVLFNNQYELGAAYGFVQSDSTSYWTSSELNDSDVMRIQMRYGTYENYGRGNSFPIRCVRRN